MNIFAGILLEGDGDPANKLVAARYFKMVADNGHK